MKTVLFLLVFFFGIIISAQTTTRTYFETFDQNDETGWGLLAYDASLSVQNGKLGLNSGADEILRILVPIGGTKDDFSIKVKADGNAEGGYGRMSFRSAIWFQFVGDSIYLFYTNDLESYVNPVINILAGYPVDDSVNSTQLNVYKEGNDLRVEGYQNDSKFYSGTITDADEGLFYGQVGFDLFKEDGEIQFSMDEIEIKYNSVSETQGIFNENFSSTATPWFRFGDYIHIGSDITIDNGRMNFTGTDTTDLSLLVMPPLGGVTSFTAEVSGGVGESNNSYFEISKFFDPYNYVVMSIDGTTIGIGYAVNSIEPDIIATTEVDGEVLSNLKYSFQVNGSTINIIVWVNDQEKLTKQISQADDKVLVGHLAVGFDRGTIIDGFLDYANFTYSNYTTSVDDNKIISQPNIKLYQNYPNPFNPSTVIQYSLPVWQAGIPAVDAPSLVEGLQNVTLKIYDILGNEVTTLVNKNQPAGNYEVTFNASGLSSGIYFYRLQTSNGYVSTRKLVLLK